MNKVKTRWNVSERQPQAEEKLQEELGVSSALASILIARGLSDPSEADRFLNPRLEDLHPPNLLPDYGAAVSCILSTKEQGKTIYVHGDYDVDGVSSTALFTRFLQKIGCKVIPHVPHRTREGYGIHLDAIQWAASQGASLFLTCDCGTSAHTQVEAAHESGMMVVITDHHGVQESLPNAEAVVNPHRTDSQYPWQELAGVGVVFKLCEGLSRELGLNVANFYRAYLDLAVLGTVADMVALRDENRIIAKFGLQQLTETRKVGARALLNVCNLPMGSPISATDIGFKIGPRINAVGRIDDSAIALDLFLTEDFQEAHHLAQTLNQINEKRKSEQLRVVEEAMEHVESSGLLENFALVVKNPGWHSGLVGLVAGKLVEKFHRPAFVMTELDGMVKGSARTIPGFDLGEIISILRPQLLSGGGHTAAAGLSFPAPEFDAIKSQIESLAKERLTSEDLVPQVDVDVELTSLEASQLSLKDIQSLSPFGMSNPEPILSLRNVMLSEVTPTSNPEHARFTVNAGRGSLSGIAFRMGLELMKLDRDLEYDIVFSAEEDTFRGQTKLKLNLFGIQESES